MNKPELESIPKNYTILICTTCGTGQGFLLKKEGTCLKCKEALIELKRV